MKLIIATIRPERLAAVQAALNKQDLYLMTVSEVLDCLQEGTPEIYRGRQIRRPVSKLRLEVAVDDWDFDAVVEAIRGAANLGQVADRRGFAMGLDECTRLCSCQADAVAVADSFVDSALEATQETVTTR
jgi:nitrogen regulatory protein P-II 2